MTQSEFDRLLSRIAALSSGQMRRLRDELDGKLAAPAPASASAGGSTAAVPAWQRVLDNMSDVPDGDFARMPTDSSEQLDHYLDGTPRRPTAGDDG